MSLPILATDLLDAGLGNVEMLVEYRLPLHDKRVDVILAGVHPKTGHDSYVVVELKQWSSAHLDPDSSASVLVPSTRGSRRPHPIEQAKGYCQYIRDHLMIFENTGASIHGAAYLHNATLTAVEQLFDLPADDDGQLFTSETRDKFHQFLRSRLATESGVEAGGRFLRSRVGTAKKLMGHAGEIIRGRDQFTLLDEQRIAFEMVMRAVQRAEVANTKEVVIVTGGPGSGKSVIALSLFGELFREGVEVRHATGSRSVTQTMRTWVAKGDKRIQSLFKYFNQFMESRNNQFTVLICDEAHRIRETSTNRWTSRHLRTGRSQISELADSARVPVFLLDEHQVVKPDEVGTVEYIKDYVESRGWTAKEVSLDGHFRSGGSRAYDEWVLHLLGLDGDGPVRWQPDGAFQVELAQSPQELEQIIHARNGNGETARISAGFCWPWSKPDGSKLVTDVQIEDWHRPWNANSERKVGSAPPSPLWATDPGGIGQIGCVYTAQAFEYDWNGVIIGPDITVQNRRLVTVRSANKDPQLTRRTDDEKIDRHIRNIYKVLLTRGMQGTVVYAVNPETQAFLRDLIPTETA